MKIDKYISELLYDHDCVIVMELGGIIAHYHPASINKALNVITPPSKRLAFNASLKNNDGLLANHISGREALNYADAVQVIRDYVEEAKSQMNEGKKLKIEKVGVLFFDKDKNLQFLPDQHANYLIDSFGMTSVHAPVLVRTAQKFDNEVEIESSQEDVAINIPDKKVRTLRWKVLEVVPAAAVLAFLLMVPPVLENLNTNMGTLLPFSRMNEYVNELKGIEPTYKPYTYNYVSPFDVPPAQVSQSSNEEVSNSIVNEPETAVVNPTPKVDEPVVVNEKIEPVSIKKEETPTPEIFNSSFANNSLSYHIIGGSFRSHENAEKLVAEMKSKNIDAEIIGQNKAGLFLVSLLSSDNLTQINDALPEMKASAISSAWVYKK